MSPRDWFWFLAGVLVTVAVMLTLRAWLRERPAQTVRPAIPAFAVPIAAALAMIGVALGIYFLLGSPDSIASAHATATSSRSTPATSSDAALTDSSLSQGTSQSTANAGSLDDVTRRLATRLATKGGSDSEWKLLAESYEYMGRAADARAARAHIASGASSDGASGAASEGGASVGNKPVAIDSQTMAEIANALDNHSAAAATGSAGTMSGSAAAPVGGAAVSGSVEIVSKLASRAGAGTTLFIYATQPNAPGPPLAVMRLRTEHWPVSFTLTDANAMVAGRNLSSAQTVQIEARISKRGEALPQSGDLVGSVTSVNPHGGHPVKITIDREIG